MCVIMWLGVAVGTVRGSLTGKMFFAPCLGTDLYLRRLREEKLAPSGGPEGSGAVAKSAESGKSAMVVKAD